MLVAGHWNFEDLKGSLPPNLVTVGQSPDTSEASTGWKAAFKTSGHFSLTFFDNSEKFISFYPLKFKLVCLERCVSN